MLIIITGITDRIKKMLDILYSIVVRCGRHSGLMVSGLVSRLRVWVRALARDINCVVFLGKTLYSRSASLHPGI